MADNIQITLDGIPHSAALEARIRERAAKLARWHGQITSCRVVVDQPHQHGRQGCQFAVRLLVSVPGAQYVVSHEHDEDVYVALKSAFDKVRRQIASHAPRPDDKSAASAAERPT